MNQKKRIDKILDAVETRVQDEVGALLGTDLVLIGSGKGLVSKSDAFDQLKGKQICTQMDITGDIEGGGCLLIGIKDAIRLGGTLIMLPGSELDEAIGREEYSEEIEDSYGEIANIIAGSFTQNFEAMYPQSCRFVRKEQEILVPEKVAVESDKPVADQMYYKSSSSMTLDGRQMGDLIMLLPAVTFGIQQSEKTEKAPVLEERVFTGSADSGNEAENSVADTKESVQQKDGSRQPRFDVGKHQKKVDRLLAECQEKLAPEIGGLLGVDVTLTDLENGLIDKKVFFDQVSGRQVLADMEVVGESKDTSYFSIGIKDAIHLGGILVMLPPSELETTISEEEFDEDARDAYGEVANIVSAVYTATFEEQYNKKFRFINKGLQEVVPAGVVLEANEPIPDRVYYCSSMSLVVDGKQLGKVHMLFPADLLQLDCLGKSGDVEVQEETVTPTRQFSTVEQKAAGDPPQKVADEVSHSLDILLIGDDEGESAKIAGVLDSMGYSVKSLSFKDALHSYVPGQLKAVYLVMKDVNEQAFGAAIKVRSACSLPIVAAGPGWTRTKVIKAVKYGVQDILLTPASREEIEENVANNLLKLAA